MEYKPKIANVVSVFFSIPFFFGDQLTYFTKKGYKIHLICSPSSKIEAFAKQQGVNYKEFVILRKFAVFQDIKSVFKLYRYFKQQNFDIVVGHTPKGALLAMVASFFARTPKRIFFRHGLVYETKSGFSKILLVNIERLTSLLATQVVCVSPYLVERSISDKLSNPEKLLLLNKGSCNGVDVLQKFNPTTIVKSKLEELRAKLGIEKENYVIGYVGRLVKDKGIPELVNAFVTLQKKHSRIKLLLVGPYEDKDKLNKRTLQLIKGNSNIITTGHIDDDMEYYYSLMNIFILPTHREGLGTSLLEASSMEIPVLTTSHTGSRDAIREGVTGSYIELSKESIFNTIDAYIVNSNMYATFGLEGRQYILRNFEQKLIWKEIETKLYY
ncbi:glycosyltransferase family 4 protein [Lutibacter sp.]